MPWPMSGCADPGLLNTGASDLFLGDVAVAFDFGFVWFLNRFN